MLKPIIYLLLTLLFTNGSAFGFTPKSELVKKFQGHLAGQVRKKDPQFQGFSAARGKTLYFHKHTHSKKGDIRSCSTCHTDDPMRSSKHAVTGKKIAPLSPLVNRKRFTKIKKMKKWFRRNCKWTLERLCTAKEKGDFLEFIYSL